MIKNDKNNAETTGASLNDEQRTETEQTPWNGQYENKTREVKQVSLSRNLALNFD